jgi:hypothetical protein
LEQFIRNTRARAREGRPRVLKSSGRGITKGRARKPPRLPPPLVRRRACPRTGKAQLRQAPIETLGHQLKGDVRLTYELAVFVYALDVALASLTSQRRVTWARNGQSALTALTTQNPDFRSSPESGLRSDIATCPKSAKRRRWRLQT